jgi:hypothetical protein
MFNLKKLPLLVVASLLALSGAAQAATTTISNGSITASINDAGTFAGWADPGGPVAGTPGLNYTGTEFTNIDTPSSWFWLKAGGTDYISQYGSSLLGTTTVGAGGDLAFTYNTGSLGLLETWHLTSPNTLSVSVQIHNGGTADLSDVMWNAGLDPDQGGSGRNTTTNTILGLGNNAAVSAADYMYGTNKTISMVNTTSASAYDIAAYISAGYPYYCCGAVDPSFALAAAQAVGFSTVSDDGISLSYNLHNLGAGQTATIGYDYVFAAVPEPETYAMLLAGLCLVGFSARRRTNNNGMMSMA